jgi:hypothetical protein
MFRALGKGQLNLTLSASTQRMSGMAETFSGKLAGISLPDVDGNTVRMGSLWANAPAVVVFLRHYG